MGTHAKPVATERIKRMPLASFYPHYVTKVEKKGRSKAELDQVISWLTGYDDAGLQSVLENKVDLETFFAEAPAYHPNASLITGTICGYRVEEIEDELMRQIRCMDKLVDEVAQGKSMDKILRTA